VDVELEFPYVFMAWCLVKHRDKFTFTEVELQLRRTNTLINFKQRI